MLTEAEVKIIDEQTNELKIDEKRMNFCFGGLENKNLVHNTFVQI